MHFMRVPSSIWDSFNRSGDFLTLPSLVVLFKALRNLARGIDLRGAAAAVVRARALKGLP